MKKTKELKQYLIDNIDPARVFSDLLGLDYDELIKNEEHLIYCPFHNDEDSGQKSFSINSKNGKYYCHSGSCDSRGSSIINFYEKYNDLPYNKTLRKLYNDYIRPIIPYYTIKEYNSKLLDSPKPLKYLKNIRFLSDSVIEKRMLGYDGDRITIPIFNQFGFCVNVRRYNPEQKTKIYNYKKGYGKNALFPIDNCIYDNIIITEGEFDSLVLESLGFKSITQTAGAGSWKDEFNKFFLNKTVYICLDNDEAGKAGTSLIIDNLINKAKTIRVVELPILKDNGKDITDFFDSGYSKKDFSALLEASKIISDNKTVNDINSIENISLIEGAYAKNYYNKIKMKARVSGKEVLPYYLAKKVKITCNNYDEHECFCTNSMEKHKIFNIDIYHKQILKLINTTDTQRDLALKSIYKIPNKCKASIDIIEQLNCEQLRLTPDVDYSDTGKFVARRAFYIGHEIDSNKSYEFDAYSVPDPQTQQVVHILTGKKDASDSIDSFSISKDNLDFLKKFKPEKTTVECIEKKFNEIADWQSEHITKIKKRNDLHIITDLTYTSLGRFEFNGETINKGMLETLILGDTRCGKGMVVEGLSKYYNLGKVASGENCSYAGLVGGVQPVGRTFMITWGLIPEQDKGLYIIDEVSSLSPDDIGKMSRVRSEGVAEITKIITERTWARARGIWISNSRSGKDLENYNNGVEAIEELLYQSEDISRFDMAIITTKNEVSSLDINTEASITTNYDMYTKEDFKNLILWAWSRTYENIKFTPRARKLILKKSIELGKIYSSAIPLIQSENIRMKIAKISASVAAKCFSTFNNHDGVLIKSGHVDYAIKFIITLYNKPNFGYDTYSKAKLSQSNLKNKIKVDTLIKQIGMNISYFIDGILDQKRLSISDIADFTGKDKFESKEMIGKLVRLRCLQKENTYYIKKPAFIKYLRNLERNNYIIKD